MAISNHSAQLSRLLFLHLVGVALKAPQHHLLRLQVADAVVETRVSSRRDGPGCLAEQLRTFFGYRTKAWIQ